MITKLLIVDDSPVARSILKKCLPQGREFEIVEAGNGQEGVEKFKEIGPELTFLDLTMPVMDGFDALVEIKKLDGGAAVVVLTADIQHKTVEKVMAAGAGMVVPKPPSAEAIEEALAKAEQLVTK